MKYAREMAGLTQVEAARRVGISPQLWNDIENGRRNATPANLRRMAEELNCPFVTLQRRRTPAELGTEGAERGAA